VAFVGYQHSPLAELVDHRLLTAGASGEAFLINTQLPLLFTADAVTKTLMETNEALKVHYMRTLKALDRLKERSE
jgi:DNA-binding MurR/RpiR family transcriptional regulator